MPEKNGIETVEEILAIAPTTVIFTMSGKDAAGDCRETARMLGARRGFEGPVRIEELLTATRPLFPRPAARLENLRTSTS